MCAGAATASNNNQRFFAISFATLGYRMLPRCDSKSRMTSWNALDPHPFDVSNSLMKFLTATVAALSIILVGCSPGPQNNEAPLRVAAAADLNFALNTLIKEFDGDMLNFPIEVTYGSSGNLTTQIAQGAPFDLLLSADIKYPEMLIASDKAKADEVFQYAVGRLVIWVRNDSPIDVESLQQAALLDPSVRKIAIANPDHAPYGEAAVAALKTVGLYSAVAPRFVLGENIAQAAQFVESGAADIGVIALSLAIAPAMADKGRYWEIPLENFPRMIQAGVIVSASGQQERAGKLRDAIVSQKGGEILSRYGFILPEATPELTSDAAD